MNIAFHPALLSGYMVSDWILKSMEVITEASSGLPDRRLQLMPGDGSVNVVSPVLLACQAAASLTVTVIVWLVVAHIYKSNTADKRATSFPAVVPDSHSLVGKDFKYGTFSCFEDINYCLYGCCSCTMDARMGDTLSMVGAAPYWHVVFLFIAMIFAGQAVAIVLVLFVGVNQAQQFGAGANWFVMAVLALWLASKRSALRAKLGDNAGNKFMMDFICYWCCGPCTAIQDARQVDEITGTRVECCCKLVDVAPQVVVAPPVMVGTVVDGPGKV